MAKLERKMGFWDVFCIAAGAMISSGLFVLPGLAYSMAGSAMVVAYGLAAVLAIPAALSKAELATAMPRSGGSYFYIERSMGALPGTFAGFAAWLSIALKSAFALVGIGAFAAYFFQAPDWITLKAVPVACCVIFAGLNAVSVKHTGRAQIIMVVILLGILGFFIVRGLPAVQHDSVKGFMEKGWRIFATAGLVFVSFGGLTKVASIAGEVRNPGRNIPRGMLLALLVVALVYIAATFVVQGVLPREALTADNYTPLSQAAEAFLGSPGAYVLAAAAILAFVTTANGGILTASRAPLAMSRDGLLPSFFRIVSPRFGTPYISVFATALFMIAVLVLLDIPSLVKFASTMMLLLFLLSNLAVIIMRSSKLQNYRPLFKSPGYPWIQLGGIAIYAFLIIDMSLTMKAVPLLTTVFFVVGSIVWFVVYVRPRTDRESAFVYMVRSAVTKELYRSTLEDELREMALERDQVVHDRFDQLIQACPILDLAGGMTSHQMFHQVAASLSDRLDMDETELVELFEAREADTSTVVRPGLAIPHVIIEGEGRFDIVLVRSVDGVLFPGHEEPVHAGVILIGTRDERNFHLRALMAIAHVAEEKDFERHWLAAQGPEHLRDLVLLSRRKRQT